MGFTTPLSFVYLPHDDLKGAAELQSLYHMSAFDVAKEGKLMMPFSRQGHANHMLLMGLSLFYLLL